MIIYCLTNKNNGKRYVGQTIKTVEQRTSEHVRAMKRGSLYPIHCAIRKYGIELFEVEVLQVCDSIDQLNKAEIEFIRSMNTRVNGYNLSEGGTGVRGKGLWNHTDAAKIAIGIGNTGKVRSESVKLQIRESVSAIMTQEMKEKISDRTCTALLNPLVRAKMEKNNYAKSRKQIVQLTLNDEYIATYKSASEAAVMTKVNKGNLCACARGCFEQAGGYKWKYSLDC